MRYNLSMGFDVKCIGSVVSGWCVSEGCGCPRSPSDPRGPDCEGGPIKQPDLAASKTEEGARSELSIPS